MSPTTKPSKEVFWNLGVLIGLVVAWNALPFIFSLHWLRPLRFFGVLAGGPMLIAMLAYWLIRGDKRRRIVWLSLAPFLCFAVGALIPATRVLLIVSLLAPNLIGIMFFSYFATIGLCFAAKGKY